MDNADSIDEKAFDTGNSDTIVYCNKDSYVYEYCIKNDIKTAPLSLKEFKDSHVSLYDKFLNFLKENIDKYCIEPRILSVEPFGHKITDCFSKESLDKIKSLIQSGEINLDTIKDGLDDNSYDNILEIIYNPKNMNRFYENLKNDLKVDAIKKGDTEIADFLDELDSKYLYNIIITDLDFENDIGNPIEYAKVLKDYFG